MDNRYLAVDIGGSSIKYAFFNEKGILLEKAQLPKTENTLPEIVDTVSSIYEKSRGTISGIAISANMIVSPDTGEIYGGSSYIMDGDSYPLKEKIMAHCDGIPVSLDKDSNAALMAELKSGNLKDVRNAIVIVLGTGIGMALYLDGKIYYGDNYFSGEASTMMIGEANPHSICDVIWGNYNGVPGFVKKVAEAIGTDEDVFDGKMMFSKIEIGDELVSKMFDEYCDTLATQIMNLTLLLDINRIAIGGGISEQTLLFDKVCKKLEKLNRYFRPSLKAPTPEIVPCKYRNDANLYGAFYSLKNQLK